MRLYQSALTEEKTAQKTKRAADVTEEKHRGRAAEAGSNGVFIELDAPPKQSSRFYPADTTTDNWIH